MNVSISHTFTYISQQLNEDHNGFKLWCCVGNAASENFSSKMVKCRNYSTQNWQNWSCVIKLLSPPLSQNLLRLRYFGPKQLRLAKADAEIVKNLALGPDSYAKMEKQSTLRSSIRQTSNGLNELLYVFLFICPRNCLGTYTCLFFTNKGIAKNLCFYFIFLVMACVPQEHRVSSDLNLCRAKDVSVLWHGFIRSKTRVSSPKEYPINKCISGAQGLTRLKYVRG